MERPTWSNKLEYHLSLFSYVNGLGSCWRFPYLALENNGAPFVYAYLLLYLLVGIPLVFLDLAWGQYSNLAPVQAFKVVPVLQGAGVCVLILSCFVLMYFGVVSYYVLMFLASSFADPFPWNSCNNEWNTKACGSTSLPCPSVNTTLANLTSNSNNTLFSNNMTDAIKNSLACSNKTVISSSAIEFWNEHLAVNDDVCTNLTRSGSFSLFDTTNNIVLSPAVVFAVFMGIKLIISVLAHAKHVSLTGKVNYMFSTFPFAVSVMMLVRCITLDNSYPALTYLFIPKSFEGFATPKLWKDAMSQVFVSLMTTWGGLLTWSSYNKFYNKFHVDATVLIITVPILSFISTVAAFCVVGRLAHVNKIDIDTMLHAVKGPMSPLVLLTEALSTMWGYKLPWSVLVFATIFLLSIPTQMPAMECILSSFSDTFVATRKLWIRDLIVVFVTLAVMTLYYFLPCIFQGFGLKVIELADTFFFAFAFALMAMVLLFMICYAFGFRLLGTNIKAMTRNLCLTSKFWLVMWGFITPIVLLACLCFIVYGIIASGVDSLAPTMVAASVKFEWCHVISWIMIGLLLVILLVFTIVHVLRSPGIFTEKLKHAFSAQPARMAAASSSNGAIMSSGTMGGNSPNNNNGHLFMGGYASHRDGDEVLVDDDIVTSV